MGVKGLIQSRPVFTGRCEARSGTAQLRCSRREGGAGASGAGLLPASE